MGDGNEFLVLGRMDRLFADERSNARILGLYAGWLGRKETWGVSPPEVYDKAIELLNKWTDRSPYRLPHPATTMEPVPWPDEPSEFFAAGYFPSLKSIPGYASRASRMLGVPVIAIPEVIDNFFEFCERVRVWHPDIIRHNGEIRNSWRYTKAVHDIEHEVLRTVEERDQAMMTIQVCPSIDNRLIAAKAEHALDVALDHTRALLPSTADEFRQMARTCYIVGMPPQDRTEEIKKYFDTI